MKTRRQILAFFSFAALISSGLYATESRQVDGNADAIVGTFSPEVALSLGVPLRSSENLSLGAVTESSTPEDASELNRELTNPVSSLWSIANQFNNFELNNGHWNISA